MAEIVERINRVSPAWNLLGFFCEKERYEDRQGLTLNGYRVLGTIADLAKHLGAALAIGNEFRDPFPIERVATLCDPAAFVSRSATIGNGCVIYPGCFIGMGAVVVRDVPPNAVTVGNPAYKLKDRHAS